MSDHPTRADGLTGPPDATAPNRYAITLDALMAGTQVPVADQVQEQPAAPAHDYSSGFDTTGGDGDGQGDARGY